MSVFCSFQVEPGNAELFPLRRQPQRLPQRWLRVEDGQPQACDRGLPQLLALRRVVLLALLTQTLEETPMSANLSRRHLFARLGGGLVALWTWLHGRSHAAANPAASALRRPRPPALWNAGGCGRSRPSRVLRTYDADGRRRSECHLDPNPEPPPLVVRYYADGTSTVSYADRPATGPVADEPPPAAS
jgi:hypothetical protein